MKKLCKLVKSELVLVVDVDDTLVLHRAGTETSKLFDVVDPVTGLNMLCEGHMPHIRLIKEEASRGKFVIVWSKGGYQWAFNVVQALGLGDYVDLCMTKPLAYVDDKPVQDWLQDRIYIGPDCRYKNA